MVPQSPTSAPEASAPNVWALNNFNGCGSDAVRHTSSGVSEVTRRDRSPSLRREVFCTCRKPPTVSEVLFNAYKLLRTDCVLGRRSLPVNGPHCRRADDTGHRSSASSAAANEILNRARSAAATSHQQRRRISERAPYFLTDDRLQHQPTKLIDVSATGIGRTFPVNVMCREYTFAKIELRRTVNFSPDVRTHQDVGPL